MRLQAALDTALLKLFVLTDRLADLDAFATSENAVLLTDAESFLLHHRLYHVVGLLYKSRGIARSALRVWSHLGSGKWTEAGYDGFEETVEFLSGCNTQDLVLEFAPWVLKKNPARAMDVFVQGVWPGGGSGAARRSDCFFLLQPRVGRTSLTRRCCSS